MTKKSGFVDKYTLPRNKTESARLEQQHSLIVQNLGFILHPRIEAALPKDARIADVATGTGIWMRDLASKAPSTWSFVGLDLSDAQFPSSEQQGRCTFDILNILEPVPEHFVHSFDVVHIRYLIAALKSHEWQIVARNVLRLLKPGCYIQWLESRFGYFEYLQSKPGVTTYHLKKLIQMMVDFEVSEDKLLPSFISPGLKNNVQENGFTDVQEDVFASDRVAENRKEANLVSIQAVYQIVQQFIRQRGMGKEEQAAIDEIYEKAIQEINDGAYTWWTMHCVTARKPL
ncbi:N-methyltransferase tcpN [Pseudocercospora fuligena]|uniref:N-methyltransferase tcpN n=1 Tax=Pseudocercospora fuligena TaxID=685502 RepID=A0A8H6RIR0_9PEZI|nr:N-methyltransferase tcpN [Pseudocercospora fuligena]